MLETAIRRSHGQREVEARRELCRLGVLVTIDARSVLTMQPPTRRGAKKEAVA
tara:strand:- start:202 stop:360 length:159 start_codon:yes stop_codon:yes gene_type:complete